MSVELARSSWDLRAACRGPNWMLFFPPTGSESAIKHEARESAAKQICSQCPVRRECLEHALQVPERYGIWGGLNEAERHQLWVAMTYGDSDA